MHSSEHKKLIKLSSFSHFQSPKPNNSIVHYLHVSISQTCLPITVPTIGEISSRKACRKRSEMKLNKFFFSLISASTFSRSFSKQFFLLKFSTMRKKRHRKKSTIGNDKKEQSEDEKNQWKSQFFFSSCFDRQRFSSSLGSLHGKCFYEIFFTHFCERKKITSFLLDFLTIFHFKSDNKTSEFLTQCRHEQNIVKKTTGDSHRRDKNSLLSLVC